METIKKNWVPIVLGLVIVWLLVMLGRSQKKPAAGLVVRGPGKTVPSRDPAMITPPAMGQGSKAQPFSPARAVTALQNGDDAFAAELRAGASIMTSIMADKMSGKFE